MRCIGWKSPPDRTMAVRRRLSLVLMAGLAVLGLTALGPGANAATCPDPGNVDCASPPPEAQFAQLTNDTLIYFPPIPIRSALIDKIQEAQEALFPPAPIHPPSPIRSYNLLGAYAHQVEALAGTPNGASDAGTRFLLDEVSSLRNQIRAAQPTIHHPPAPIQPGT